MEKYSDKQIKGFLSQVLRTARKMGCGEDTEDIAQEVVSAWIRRGKHKQSVEQGIIEALRLRSGRRDSPHYHARRIVEFRNEQNGIDALSEHEVPPFNPNFAIDFKRTVDTLERDDRIIYVLRNLWGLTLGEIGYLFGITESAICLRVRDINSQIMRFTKKKTKHTKSYP